MSGQKIGRGAAPHFLPTNGKFLNPLLPVLLQIDLGSADADASIVLGPVQW